MKAYHSIVQNILEHGELKKNRTGVSAITLAGAMFEHDMSTGFPLLTTKKMPFKMIATELEFFIKGYTDKQWLKDRNNHIWDEWANPLKAQYGHDADAKQRMTDERDLGPIYGFQWRHFNAPYQSFDTDYSDSGYDQLKKLTETLKQNPSDRRMIVSAWNPLQISEMALPPCHYSFQVTVINNKLNLLWNQRSVDTMLGLPFNIASYGLLLHLLARDAGLQEGRLIGFLGDTHIYENHVDGAREQLTRDTKTYPLCSLETSSFTSIFNWSSDHTKVMNYTSHPKIEFAIAV